MVLQPGDRQWPEGTQTHVEGNAANVQPLMFRRGKQRLSEVQASRGGGYCPGLVGEDCLVAVGVVLVWAG